MDAKQPNAAFPVSGGVSPDGMTLQLRVLRRLALVVAVGGLALLHRAARLRDLPWVTADDLTPSMQFAPVRAAGVLAEPARVHRRDGTITVVALALDTNGQRLNVVAFGDVARTLVDDDRLPTPGDHVELTGVVQFSPRYGPQIHLRQVDHLSVGGGAAGSSP